MNDPAAPRQAKGWPLAAISILVLLLAGFLVLKLRKPDPIPAVVKEPPPAVAPPEPVAVKPDVKPDVKPADPVKPAPATEPAPKTADTEFEEKLKALKKALQDKRWDEATAALEAARKLRPGSADLQGIDEAIAAGRKKEEAELAEAARLRELKVKQERAWAVVKDQVEKDRAEDKWDAALKALVQFKTEFPDADRDEDYKRSLRQVTEFQGESDKLFLRDMAEAEKNFAAEHFGLAVAMAENALKYYPERAERVREFQGRVRAAQSEKTMVRIPETLCWVGSELRPDEMPLRQVKVPAFLIDKYEVTNEDYYAFVAASGHEAPMSWNGRKVPKGRERHPVVLVTWDDAAAYAKWAGKRLPSAEEWEVAARGPDKREFPWGNVFAETEGKVPANCLEYWQINKTQAPGPTPVDQKDFDNGVSAFGVYGMGGNVWEWTATAAPPKGSKPPPEFRILKGGSFMTPQKALRCANNYAEDPRLPHPDVGFRCARDIK